MPQSDRPATYEIVIAGHLGDRWRDWLSGMAITYETSHGAMPTTKLDGAVRDQAALRGLLGRLWDLGLVVISVSRTNELSAEATAPACGKE